MVAPSFDYEYTAVPSSGSPHTRDGQATTTLGMNFTSSNGVDMLGQSDVEASSINWSTTGGGIIGGESERVLDPVLRTSEGGVLAQGLAGITADYPNVDSDTGSEPSAQGTASVNLILSHSGNGGIVLGGSIETDRVVFGSGGFSISGQAEVVSAALAFVSSGGFSISGDATERPGNFIASGGASVSGASDTFITGYNEESQGSLTTSKESYVDIISGENPIAYWKLDEKAGSAVAENSGSLGTAVDGSYNNFPSVGSTGIVESISSPNRSVGLDGVNDYIGIPNNSSINTGVSYTNKSFELWAKIGNVSPRQTLYEQGGEFKGVNIYVLNGRLYAFGYGVINEDATTPWQTSLSSPVANNQIYHVVVTFDQPSSQFKLYLNGEEVDSGSCGTLFQHGGDVAIGGAPNGSRYHDSPLLFGNYFRGSLNHVSLQNRTLTASEVRKHYSAGIHNFNMILSQEATGGLTVGGESLADSTNPIILSGQADVSVTNYNYISTGSVQVSGSAITDGYKYTSSGGLVTSGESVTLLSIPHVSNGGVVVAGQVDQTRRFEASGGISVTSPSLFTLMTEALGFWPLDEGTGPPPPNGSSALNYGSLGAAENGVYYGAVDWDFGLIPTESPLVASFATPSDDRVERSDGVELRTGGDKSFELWFKPDRVSGRQAIFTSGNSTTGFNVYLAGTQLYVGAWDLNNSWQSFIEYVPALEINEIYHVVAVFNENTSFSVYVNGNLIDTKAGVGALSTIPAATGYFAVRGNTRYHDGIVSGIGSFYRGEIGYVALYNRTLSSSEVDIRQSYAYFPYSLSIPSESDGGILLSGVADLTFREEGTGGVSISGQSDITTPSYVVNGSGGLIVSGDSSDRGNLVGTGGVLLSGESIAGMTNISVEGSGGLTINGDSEEEQQYFAEGSGGVALSGTAEHSVVLPYASSGGCVVSGESDLTPHIEANGGASVLPHTLSNLILQSKPSPVGFWKFSESSGTIADNLGTEGSSLDGEYVGSVDLGSPSIIQSTSDTTIDLSASDADRVVIPDGDSINTGGPYTQKSIEMWFLPTQSSIDPLNVEMPLWWQGVGSPYPETNNFGHGIQITYGSRSIDDPNRGNYIDVVIYDSTTDAGIAEPWSLRIGGGLTPNAGGDSSNFIADWGVAHQLVVTFESSWPSSGATLKAYLNGQLIGTQTTTKLARLYDDRGSCDSCNPSGDRNSVGGHLGYVGQSGSESARFFEGQIGYTAYWNSVLSSEEVSNHYNAGFYLYSMSIPYTSTGGISLEGSAHLARAYGGVTASGQAEAAVGTWVFESSGGVSTSGQSGVISDYYIVQSAGGLTIGGDSTENEQYFVEGSGGLVTSGESEIISSAFSFMSSGGLIASGDALERPANWVGTGGVVVSGSYRLGRAFVASGGLTASGESITDISGFGYNGLGGVVISGDSSEEIEDYQYISSGGLSLSGSSISGIRFYFASSGLGPIRITENIFNKTEVRLEVAFLKDFQWSVNGEVYSFKNFQWDVGELPLQFYRVEGDCLQPDCDNSTFNDGEECTQGKRFFQTVVAKSVSDVCEKLKEAYFSYPMIWPVKSIKRYSRPANLNVIADQQSQGVDHDCLELIEEEFCQIPECAEFCLSEQAQVFMGVSVKIQDTFFVYEASGGLATDGESGEIGNYFFEASGGLAASGTISRESSAWDYESVGSISISGEAELSSQYYNFSGSGSLQIGGTIANESSSYAFVASSGILFGGDSIERVVLGFVPLYPLITLTGESSASVPAYSSISSGGILTSGESLALSDYVSYEGEGGVSTSGGAGIISSAYSYSATGGLAVSGEYLAGFDFESSGGLSILGSSDFTIDYNYEALGGILTSGQSDILSSSWSYASLGGLDLEGTADTVSSYLGLIVAYAGVYGELTEEEAVFPGQLTGDTLTIDEGTVTTNCGCNPLPLTISLKHNLNKSALLKNFSALNNISLPNIITLRHDTLYDSWRNNIQYSGIGLDGVSQERWTFLFDFGCNTSDVLSQGQSETPNWKLSLYLKRKNLSSLEDSDTRLLYTLSTDTVCQNDKLEFVFNLDVDTKTTFVEGNTDYVVDYEVFHDAMGFFGGGDWLADPNLTIQISESPLPSGVRRVDISQLFPV